MCCAQKLILNSDLKLAHQILNIDLLILEKIIPMASQDWDMYQLSDTSFDFFWSYKM